MSLANPENDEFDNSDSLKVHKDISWIIKTVWSLVVFGFIAGGWLVGFGLKVDANATAISEKADKDQVEYVQDTLDRIEGTINSMDVRQREMNDAVIRLETNAERNTAK